MLLNQQQQAEIQTNQQNLGAPAEGAPGEFSLLNQETAQAIASAQEIQQQLQS